MHNDGILLIVNELGMHKTTMSERVCLQSGLINIMHKKWPYVEDHIFKTLKALSL